MRKIFYVVIGVMMFASGVQATAEDYSRKGAKAQSSDLRLRGASDSAPLRLCASNLLQGTSSVSIEVFQVLELPLNVHEAALVKKEKSYFLQLSLANSSDSKMLGLRYSLIRIDSQNQPQPIANRTEGMSMPAYATKTLTFKSPLKFKLKDGERLVLMLEQVISGESIWEVVKAKEAFDAYAKGDYSVIPVVLRVANQLDAPPVVPQVIRRIPNER